MRVLWRIPASRLEEEFCFPTTVLLVHVRVFFFSIGRPIWDLRRYVCTWKDLRNVRMVSREVGKCFHNKFTRQAFAR